MATSSLKTTSMKFKRRGKAKNVEEIEKPRGFDRGLELDQIIAAANLGKTPMTLQFLVRWVGCDELDLIAGPEMNEKLPDRVLEYYASISPINRRFEENEKEQLAMALRPAIVSKVEQMLHSDAMTSDDLYRAVAQEALADEVIPDVGTGEAMVQIPQEYNTDGVLLSSQPSVQQPDISEWATQDQAMV